MPEAGIIQRMLRRPIIRVFLSVIILVPAVFELFRWISSGSLAILLMLLLAGYLLAMAGGGDSVSAYLLPLVAGCLVIGLVEPVLVFGIPTYYDPSTGQWSQAHWYDFWWNMLNWDYAFLALSVAFICLMGGLVGVVARGFRVIYPKSLKFLPEILGVMLVIGLVVFSVAPVRQSHVSRQISSARACHEDADCVNLGSYCPFSCVVSVNRSEQDRIIELLEGYETDCESRCRFSPKEVRCSAGRCEPAF